LTISKSNALNLYADKSFDIEDCVLVSQMED
jgi:hypothetical protein